MRLLRPSALRFLIGHDLRATHEHFRWKHRDASTALGCSQAKINYLESGKTQQQPEQVTADEWAAFLDGAKSGEFDL